MMNEQELLEDIAEAKRATQLAQKLVSDAKKRCMDAETVLIEAKLALSKAVENHRVWKVTTPMPSKELRDLDIEEFRHNNPEVCEYARLRDANRKDEE